MSSFSKLVLVVAMTALGSAAALAQTRAPVHSGFKARSVIASHEAAPSLSAVVQHRRHRLHHRKHRAHPVRHVR